MKKGIVNYYNSDKDYGFITEFVSLKEYYIHATVITETIRENDLISFDLKEREDHFIAVNIRLSLN